MMKKKNTLAHDISRFGQNIHFAPIDIHKLKPSVKWEITLTL